MKVNKLSLLTEFVKFTLPEASAVDLSLPGKWYHKGFVSYVILHLNSLKSKLWNYCKKN